MNNSNVQLIKNHFLNVKYNIHTLICKRAINSKNPNAKTPAERKAIRAAGGIGDTPLIPSVVPSDSTRRRRKKAAIAKVETGPTVTPTKS